MPTTITTPPIPGPLGPGGAFTVSTDLIGPIPADAFWRIDITDTPGEWRIWSCVRPSGGQRETRIVWGLEGELVDQRVAPPLLEVGHSISIGIDLESPTVGAIDTGRVNGYQVNTQLGIGVLVPQLSSAATPESPLIQQIWDAVYRRFTV